MRSTIRSMMIAAAFSLTAGTFALSTSAMAEESDLTQFSPYTQGGGADVGAAQHKGQQNASLEGVFAPSLNTEYAQGGGMSSTQPGTGVLDLAQAAMNHADAS